MIKFDVETIEEEAQKMRKSYRGRKGKVFARVLYVAEVRLYVDKVLFLCKEIEKLNKRLAP